jgi:hypothetical protein
MAGEFAAVERLISQSVIARTEDAVQRTVTSAFAQSRSHAAATGLIRSFRSLSTAPRLRLSGIALLTFIVVHVGWRFVMPAGVAPAMPITAWLWLALVALTLILAPEGLVRAWHARRSRRVQAHD